MSKNQQKRQRSHIGLVIVIVLLAAVMLWVMTTSLARPDDGHTDRPVQTTLPVQTHAPSDAGAETVPALPMDLGNGLTVTDAGAYSGVYMEDGSNESVSGVFMIRVRNDSDADLQYGEILLREGEASWRFQVTNLPAGREVILLEQDRSPVPEELPGEASVQNLAWFSDAMSAREDMFRITGARGVVNVENLSDRSIAGDIYVYYKYVSEELFFGGITFRVRIEGGLEAGEIRQIPSGHFDPGTCEILDVRYYE